MEKLKFTVPIPPLNDRQWNNFWAKVTATGFCWEWEAHRSAEGYGQFNIGRTGRKFPAHRIAYTLLVGPITAGLELDHLCRNRACVNPDHLDPVTSAENNRRIPEPLRMTAGSIPPWMTSGKNVTGACSRGHEYTEANTYHYKDGRTDCRTCRKINRAAYRARTAAKT